MSLSGVHTIVLFIALCPLFSMHTEFEFSIESWMLHQADEIMYVLHVLQSL